MKLLHVVLGVTLFCASYCFAQETPVAPIPSSFREQSQDIWKETKEITGVFLKDLDLFRLKQAEYFKKLKQETQATLDATSALQVDKDAFPIEEKEGVVEAEKKPANTFTQTVLLVIASSLTTFFSQKILFYAVVVLFVFLFLRFFYRMFI